MLEIVTGATEAEVDNLVVAILPSVPRITDYVLDHRTNLVKPFLCFDTSALALTFVPATREAIDAESSGRVEYTDHHLRRDVHSLAIETGIQIEPRYILPSAHLTIARHVSQDDIQETERNGQHRVDRSKL
jgi:vesicle-fusing ATPase